MSLTVNNLERIQKVIAHNSEYSRRKAEELISQGKVSVNGKIVTELGTKVSGEDEILVDGNVIYQQEKEYYLLNKPIRVVSTCSDEKERTTVIDLIPSSVRLYPVGRLDYYTSGLIILTNDGELANGLMHPKKEVKKTYRVSFTGEFYPDKLKKLRYGVDIGGYITTKADVKLLSYDQKIKSGRLLITIHEGKNQQIRKMIEAVGCRVKTLKRVGYAFFELNQEALSAGEYRALKPKEVKQLYHLIK